MGIIPSRGRGQDWSIILKARIINVAWPIRLPTINRITTWPARLWYRCVDNDSEWQVYALPSELCKQITIVLPQKVFVIWLIMLISLLSLISSHLGVNDRRLFFDSWRLKIHNPYDTVTFNILRVS